MENWGNYNQFWFIVTFINKMRVEKDKFGVKLKFPDKECKSCKKYPCFQGMERCSSNFAAYGCIYYRELNSSG